MPKVIAIYTGNNAGFRKYLDYRKARISIKPGFTEILAGAVKAVH